MSQEESVFINNGGKPIGQEIEGHSWWVPSETSYRAYKEHRADHLSWTAPASENDRATGGCGRRMLDHFIRSGISEDGPARERFVRRYGLLSPYLDEHDHEPGSGTCDVNDWTGTAHLINTLLAARVLSRTRPLIAVLALAGTEIPLDANGPVTTQLRSRIPGKVILEESRALQGLEEHGAEGRAETSYRAEVFVARAAEAVINEMLRLDHANAPAGLSSLSTSEEHGFKIEYRVNSLIGGLALQLNLFMTTDRHGRIAQCAECGEWYEGKTPARRRQRNFCESCRTSGAPSRASTRDKRERERQAKASQVANA